jgi:asparagine synthase (glutamine-hydrolysing)
LRIVGVGGAAPPEIERFASAARQRGLEVVDGPGVAMAWVRDARPAVLVARHDDGSFVVVDGELFGVGADEVLDRLRVGGVRALLPLHFEALLTWFDARSGEVTVARDHGGVVPGLVGTVGRSTVWSSDHESLLDAGLAAVPDPLAIAEHVRVGWVTPPRSFLRDARTLPAGHAAVVQLGSTRVDAWFRHTARPPLQGDQAEALGSAVIDAVRRRSTATKLGATLSAGVDSAVVVAVLRKVLELDVQTFTFRYLGYEGQLNEDEFAAETAAVLGVSHTVIPVTPQDLADRFVTIVADFQSPVTFGVHSFLQDPIRDAGVDVVLGGSDAGFWHVPGRAGVISSWLRRVPARTRVALLAGADRARTLPKGEAAYWTALASVVPMKSSYTSIEEQRALFGEVADVSAVALARALSEATDLYRDEPAEYRTAFVFEQLAVPQYVGQWNHRWGRTFGFPVRAPLWDHGVMHVAERRRPWTGDKPVLREFAATLLPRERAYAPKIYQEMPLQHWFRGPLRGFVHDALSRERVERAGIVEHAGVQAILDDHDAGANRQWPLWQLMTAVEWALQLRERRPVSDGGAG